MSRSEISDEGAAGQRDAAALQRQLAADQAEKCGLARAIAADKADLVALGNGGGGALKQRAAFDGVGDVINAQHGQRLARSSGRRQSPAGGAGQYQSINPSRRSVGQV